MLSEDLIKEYIKEFRPRFNYIKSLSKNEEALKFVFIELLNEVGSQKIFGLFLEKNIKTK